MTILKLGRHICFSQASAHISFNAAIATSQSHSSYLMNLSSAFSICASVRLLTEKVQRSTSPSHLSYELTPIFNTSTCIHQSKRQGSEHTHCVRNCSDGWGLPEGALPSFPQLDIRGATLSRTDFTHKETTYYTHNMHLTQVISLSLETLLVFYVTGELWTKWKPIHLLFNLSLQLISPIFTSL